MSTKGKEYKLAIRIAGIIDKSFTTSLATANTALKRNITALDKNFTTLDKGFDKIMGAGQKCFDAIASAAGVATLAIGAATAASIAVGTEFESAFAGVKKTVDATAEEYEELRQDILEMTRTIPSSAAEIATVMEIAGQLGIAKDALTDFTETMINLGVSTTVSAEEASESLAKFTNIMTMENYGADGISNFERLGSAIVDLGNNFATTEGDIIHIGTQLAAAGKLAGMSEADIMGISAAMSSVGLTAEAGASSMSRLIMQMQQAVAAGGDELTQYGEVVGMTGEQFAALFRDDAAMAVVEFIAGLNEAGEDSYGILEDLELSTIRTRKAFLSLAGADDLMLRAVNMSNEAWNENTALAIEAGKRYETTESQLQIMINAFKELGIVAYDDLRGPFIDVIQDITEGVYGLTEYVGGADGISKWIKNIGTELPTLQRKVKKHGKAVLDFFNPLIEIGKWFIKNPNVIVSAIAGIGAALAAYNIASTITHIVTALMSLTPATAVIMAVVAAIGLLVGGIMAYKQHEQEMIDRNLEEHFGNIALSMEEIQAIAEHIVSSDSLGGVKKALEAFEDLDGISATMEEAISEIDKMNWKVSIGMELTPDEQETYKTTIAEYVAAAQEYALQSQYAVSLNLGIAFDGADAEGQTVVDKVNQFYQDKYDELSGLGTQLNQAVTDAFNDGLLDIKETKVIAEIQAQMAEIQKSLATGEFDAQLSILGMEYAGGASLDADSFQNLQEELATQVAEATQAYKESYAQNYASIQAAYEAGDYLTYSEYQTALDELQKDYLKNVGDVQMRALNFQLETIMEAYSDELDPAIDSYLEGIREAMSKADTYDWENDWKKSWEKFWPTVYDSYNAEELDKTTRGALQELLDAMAPTMEDIEELRQQYSDLGVEMSAAMAEGLYNYNLIAVLADNGSMMSRDGISDGIDGSYILGQEMGKAGLWDSFYEGLLSEAKSSGYVVMYDYIKKGAADAAAGLAAEEIAAAEETVRPVVEGMYAWSQETIDEYFSKGFTTEADLGITLNPSFKYNWRYLPGQLPGLPNINQRADGGLATRPELTWFAENGPEMAIPIDGSQNAISLWEQTGRLLGMDSVLDGLDLSGGGNAPTIEYKPTLQFYGEAPSREDLDDALKVSQDEFDLLMERYFKTHGRVSFG